LQRTLLEKPAALMPDWREVVFTVSEAKRALLYVAAVARDAARAFGEAHRCRTALQQRLNSRERSMLSHQRDAALNRLNIAIDDCNAVGADLMDLNRGVVRFSAHIEGRPASLVWRVGEPVTDAWSDLLELAAI
jgi:hypothetical protein